MAGESLEPRLALAAVPVAGLSLSAQSMIGESLQFNVSFDNQPSGPSPTGYGPYVDLFIDATGADGVSPGGAEPTDFDGLSGLTASYLGATLTPIAVTLGPGGTYTHPLARTLSGAPLTGTAPAGFVQGDVLYVLELPFGSYVDTQPVANLTISTSLSSEADLGSPLRVAARGGFRYGLDPLDNPTTDPSILGAVVTATTTPTVIRLTKQYDGPENETATGPNFPRRYTLTADVANGQTIDDLRLIDLLPDDLAFLDIVSISAGGSEEDRPTVGVATLAPNNDLIVHFPSVTGGPGGNDASVVFEYFVPEFDASGNRVISHTTGDDAPTVNDSRATGSWTPVDPSDSVVAINIVDQTPADDNHTLTNKSIAIQKSHTILTDVGAAGPSPGDTVEYTLNFQISDYFTFGDLVIEDIVSDGQRLQETSPGVFPGPFTLSVTDRTGPIAGNFSPSLSAGATNLFIDLSEIGGDTNPATDGTTRLVFDVSRAMQDLGAADGILQGGRATAPDAGPAVGTLTYRTVIQQSFSDTYPSGESNVDQGDLLSNAVTVTGTVRSNGSILNVLDTESDTSSDAIEIVTGSLLKTTYAVNGVLGSINPATDTSTGLVIGPSYDNSLRVRPGDVVTYRLRYTLPTGDIENFRLTDFLPLPVYDASVISTVFGTTIDASVPAADSAKYGPDHTFSRVPLAAPPTQHPTVSVSSSGNSVTFNFGNYSDPPPESMVLVDVLISVTISNQPMADGLYLTNQVLAEHGTTNAGLLENASISQITLTEPALAVRKGVVSSSNPNAVFSSAIAPSGIVFEGPALNTPGSSFSGGTINSTNLGSTLNSNVSRVDADDVLKFAIVVENFGTSSAGAFDVRIRDSLPAGLVVPTNATALNLEVFDGSGLAIPFSMLGTGLFDPAGGIELTDPGATPAIVAGSPPQSIDGGSLDQADPSDGHNVAIITFDLQVAANVAPGQTANLLNTATVFNFAGEEAGPDHTDPTDLTDTAQVTIATPVVTKTRVGTSFNHATNNDAQAVIGELVTYDLVVRVPEGTMPNAQVVDTLDNGLAFVDVVSFSASPALTIQNPTGTGNSPSNATITNSGRTVTFGLGNVTNGNSNNAVAETITIRYRAVVLNVGGNQGTPATNLNNSALLTWTGGSIPSVGAPTVAVIEPVLDVTKVANSPTIDALDTVTYTVTVSHAVGSNTEAYDVSLVDVVPPDLNYVPSSWTHTGGTAPDTIGESGSTLSAFWNAFPIGATSTFQFQATVTPGIQAGSSVVNTATGTWTSLPGPVASDLSIYNSNSRERTGAGGVNDYLDTGVSTVTVAIQTSKTLVATSENSTTGTGVAIGEIVRYRLAAQIPEGSAPNFQLNDQLPDGLQFLDDGTATLALVSNGAGLTSSTLVGNFSVVGSSSSIVPSEPLPSGAISGGPFVSGTDPMFSLGSLTNADDDADGEFVVLEFNALVTNTAGNVATTDLDNSFIVRVAGSQVGAPSPIQRVTVVEPSITNLAKVPLAPADSGVDGGQVVTYRLTYSNPSGATRSSAFDARVLDSLPAELTSLTNVRVFRNGSPLSSGFVDASSSTTLDVTLLQVAPGDSIEIRYDATVVTSVAPGFTIGNGADLTYTSLPGPSGTTVNPTGSTTGSAGSSTGERTGAGGVNSYLDNDLASVTVNSHTISGFAYHDQNNDGVFNEAASAGIPNVSVRIQGTDHLGNTVDVTQLTNGAGAYSFGNLRPGSYTVTEVTPGGYLNGRDTLGSPVFGAVNANRYDDSLGTLSIPLGTASTTSSNHNFGELLPATIAGFVYVDANNNGLRGAEPPLASVPILLEGTNDLGVSVSLPALTDVNGAYSFGNLRPGTYQVTEAVQPGSFVDGFETSGNVVLLPGTDNGSDVIGNLIVSSGQVRGENNFGEVPPASITGRVFSDVNNNGVMNGVDQGIGGVVVSLSGTDINGNSVSRSTTTLSDGTYRFDLLMAGTYTVTEPVQPAGFADGQDSRAGILLPGSIGTDSIPGIVVPIGGAASDNNFAEVPGVTPSGFVYIDANNNGLRDSGEVGLAGVEITLTGIGNDVFGNPVPSRTAFTDVNGRYEFANVPPAVYAISESQPAGFQDGLEQNGTPAAAVVANDQFSGIDLTNTTTGGSYNFGELSPSGRLTGSVYVDANGNGRRDSGELGLAGVVVTLVNENSPQLTYQVVTDLNGNYQFVKMFPGQYRLIESQPVNFVDGRDTRGNAGGVVTNDRVTGISIGVNQTASGYLFGEAGIDPARISKRLFLTSTNPSTDFTGPAGTGITAVSAPLADPAGYVYLDLDENGRRDIGEPGISDVLITLTGTTSQGQAVRNTTRTDAQGFYQFAFLPAGVYTLEQTQPFGYADGAESLGSLGGVVGNDRFTQIVLRDGDLGVDYNFGERRLVQASVPGDANRDGIFDSADLLLVFQAGEYEDGIAGNSSFEEGDWDGDGDFTSADLILALRSGGYSPSALDAALAEL